MGTSLESDPPFDEADKRRHRYRPDLRLDSVQVVIALIVTPQSLPLACAPLPGNTGDSITLRSLLARIERPYGKAQRVRCLDRGVPTEAVLEEIRRAEPPV